MSTHPIGCSPRTSCRNQAPCCYWQWLWWRWVLRVDGAWRPKQKLQVFQKTLPFGGFFLCVVCSVPGSYKQFAALTSIEEGTGIPAADEMIRLLVEAQGTVVRNSREVFRLASNSGDEPSSDL